MMNNMRMMMMNNMRMMMMNNMRMMIVNSPDLVDMGYRLDQWMKTS